MATQQYIAEQEAKLIEAREVVKQTLEAYDMEIHHNDGIGPYHGNYDHWGTLAMNAHGLAMQLEELNQRILADKTPWPKHTD